MARDQAAQDDPMQEFYRELEGKSMDALWRRHQQGDRPSEPLAPYQPARWRSSDVLPFIKKAGDLVQPGPEAQRRVIQLVNPSVQSKSATHTLSGNVQMVLPGEVAPSHRHTNAAIRFIMHGTGLDGPLVSGMLKVARYQQYPDELEPATKPLNASSRFGAGVRPMWQRGPTLISPQLLYPWAQTEQALRDLAKVGASPFDDVAFEYTNPTTGSHVLPTIGCCIQMLRPGVHTQAHRHCASAVYHAFRGRGSTIVDGVQIDWEEGDFFALPPWCWHEFVNGSATDEAILFHTTDLPVMESLGLYDEHAYEKDGGHQQVTGGYDERYGTAVL